MSLVRAGAFGRGPLALTGCHLGWGRKMAAMLGLVSGILLAPSGVISTSAEARPAPESFADIVEKIAPAVVNISTSKALPAGGQGGEQFPFPQPPPGSPFEDFFREFFDRERSPGTAIPASDLITWFRLCGRSGRLCGHQQSCDRGG